MKAAIRIVLITLSIFLSSVSLNAQDYNLYFDLNSDTMRIDDVGKLHDLINSFNPKTNTIRIVGFADTTGNNKFNLDLSKRRAISIKDYIVKKGIAATSIKIDYKGETNDVSTDNFYNRRVEIYLMTKEKEIKTFTEFVNSMKPSRQNYKFQSYSDLRIEGKKGTVIKIPANSFMLQDGKPANGELQLVLTEYYDIKDFFSEKLTTISDGNLLSSGGMVNINAYKDGKELQLYKDAEIELAFPKSGENRFFTFYGERAKDGAMNWVLDKKLYERARKKAEDIYGATFSVTGDSLVVTDKKTARERNKRVNLNPITKTLVVLTEKDKVDIEKYYQEQEKINTARSKYYNILSSSKMRFINCDAYMRETSMVIVNYKVEIENEDLNILTAVLLLKKTNSIMTFSNITNKEMNLMARLPINQDIELLVMGMKDSTLFAYHNTIKLTANKIDKIELKKSDYKTIRKNL